MTVAIGINCKDGIVVACDSLTTFGRGAPVLRYSNKVQVIKHDSLLYPVTLAGAGYTAYLDKFIKRACRQVIASAHSKSNQKLDILDFCERVCEPLVTILLKEYQIDRNKLLGVPMSEFSLSMIVAGATKDRELLSYIVFSDGLTEPIEQYGTIGSGAAYAELFLRYLLTEEQLDTQRAGRLATYAVSGVELMDPNVGGKTSVKILKMDNNNLEIKDFPSSQRPQKPKEKMEQVLKSIGGQIEKLIVKSKVVGGKHD